jgi:hypothetical protein
MAALIKSWIKDIKTKVFYGLFAGVIKSNSIMKVAIDDSKYKIFVIV